ncbi:DE-cadherin [Cyphomyrmex costatus]|uniref:DE-cadherin n=1 Tax=Cyphomyrmex costatus TaxID=456900 RepID=A0A195CSA5_9HYME|nr:DE-cadherin [Cyphomyrmex costatus]
MMPSLPINPLGDLSRGCPTPSNTRANSCPFLLRFQLDENHNHKPVFSNCSNYAPVLKEEQLPHTKVIQVHAEDRDPPEDGGTVTYSFLIAPGDRIKFEIDNKTGLITTTQVLDRDEPAREKEAYLTILATDNGRPQLDAICALKVIIEDENDNKPAFDKAVRC